MIALDFFFSSVQHVKSVFLGQDQEELGLKKDSLHIPNLIPPSLPSQTCSRSQSPLTPKLLFFRRRSIYSSVLSVRKFLNELVDLVGVLETD